MPTSPSGIRYFTVLRSDVHWQLPAFMTPIGNVSVGATDLTEQFPDAGDPSGSLAEFAQLFALRRLLQEQDESGFVGIGLDRRFAVSQPDPIGGATASALLISPANFKLLPAESFVGDGESLIVPPLLDLSTTVLAHYNAHHVTRDLLFFFALAVDLEFVPGVQAAAFLSQPMFIANGHLGVFPARWLVTALTALEAVAREFEKHFLIERDGYQHASTAFCCERLMGLLVQGLLNQWPPSDRRFHRLLLVHDSEAVLPADLV